MSNTPRLNMPEITESQLNKYITHNEALQTMDALVQCVVERIDLVTSPSVSTSDDGKLWIVAGTGGDWSGFSVDDIAQYYNGSWFNYVPEEGWVVFDKNTSDSYYYTGAAWSSYSALIAGNTTVQHVDVKTGAFLLRGNSDPDIVQVRNYTYGFDASAVEEVFVDVELPNNYPTNQDIVIEVHWSPTTANTGTVVWGIDYSWANIDAQLPALTTVTIVDAIAGGGEQYYNKKAVTATISGTGKQAESILSLRVYRDAIDTSDTYADDAALLQVSINYE